MPEAGFFYGRTFNYMTFLEQRHASGIGSGATIMFVSVGMMSNTWVLIIAGRQAKRPDIKYRVDQKKMCSQKIIVFHELLSLGCINFKNLCAHHQEEFLRFPKHPQLVKFG